MVEDEVNKDTCDRDIEPDRHRPAAKPPMSIPAALKSRDERRDHQRQGHEREQHVRNEKRKINPRDQAGVAGRFFTDVHVIDNVTDQETARCDQSDDHARHVALPDVALIQNQPAEMKMVLTALSDALIAGRSEIVIATDSHR